MKVCAKYAKLNLSTQVVDYEYHVISDQDVKSVEYRNKCVAKEYFDLTFVGSQILGEGWQKVENSC